MKKKSSKRYKKLIKTSSNNKAETLEVAIKKIKENCTAKFDESIDVSLNLNLKQKKEEANLRTVINLPHGNGKKIKVKTDDNFQILLEFKNKCLAVVTTGFTMQQYNSPAIELYGAEGTIQMLGDDWEPKGYEVWDNRRSSWELFKTPYANWPWTAGLTHLVDCIINKKKPIVNLDHAYHVNEIMIKIYESSKKKKQISVNSSFKSLNFKKNIKIKKSHLDHDRNHDDI